MIVFFSNSSFSFSLIGPMNGSKMERSERGHNFKYAKYFSYSIHKYLKCTIISHQNFKFSKFTENTAKVTRDVGILRHRIIVGNISKPPKTALSPFSFSCLRRSHRQAGSAKPHFRPQMISICSKQL